MGSKSLVEQKVAMNSVFYFNCSDCQATLNMSVAEVKQITTFVNADCSAPDSLITMQKKFYIVCPECHKNKLQFEIQKRFDDFMCRRRITGPSMEDLDRMTEAIQLLGK